MDAIILIDADSQLFQSCLCKVEDTEDGKGFIYDLDDATVKFDEKIMMIVNKIEEDYAFNVKHTVLFLEGYGNFRYSFNKTYKANRKDKEKPPLLKPLKEWIVKNYNNDIYSTFESINVETDDSIAATYLQYRLNDYGIQLILASGDKDLKTIPCLLFDTYWSRMELQSIDELEAKRNFYKQMITGDTADGVKGIPRAGEVKANKVLKDLQSVNAMNSAVYRMYKQSFGRNAKIEFLKAYYSLQMNTANVNTPNLELVMF
jgi:5'-3' exonuclease